MTVFITVGAERTSLAIARSPGIKNLQEGIEVVDEIKKIGQRALHIQADVSDPDQVEEMIERVIRSFK